MVRHNCAIELEYTIPDIRRPASFYTLFSEQLTALLNLLGYDVLGDKTIIHYSSYNCHISFYLNPEQYQRILHKPFNPDNVLTSFTIEYNISSIIIVLEDETSLRQHWIVHHENAYTMVHHENTYTLMKHFQSSQGHVVDINYIPLHIFDLIQLKNVSFLSASGDVYQFLSRIMTQHKNQYYNCITLKINEDARHSTIEFSLDYGVLRNVVSLRIVYPEFNYIDLIKIPALELDLSIVKFYIQKLQNYASLYLGILSLKKASNLALHFPRDIVDLIYAYVV